MPASPSAPHATSSPTTTTQQRRCSKKYEADPSSHTQQLYALYKQATQDPPIEKAEAPGMFDLKVRSLSTASCSAGRHPAHISPLQGKAKKRAWQKVVDEGVTPTDAEQQYVALVESLKTKYGYDG
jgi:diazepam-binding inhibitor (GABA receptor modulator, acyl-CoA-binding protein)